MKKLPTFILIFSIFQKPCVSQINVWKFDQNCVLKCFGSDCNSMTVDHNEFCDTPGVFSNKCCGNRTAKSPSLNSGVDSDPELSSPRKQYVLQLNKRRYLTGPYCFFCIPISCLFAKFSAHHQVLCDEQRQACRRQCGNQNNCTHEVQSNSFSSASTSSPQQTVHTNATTTSTVKTIYPTMPQDDASPASTESSASSSLGGGSSTSPKLLGLQESTSTQTETSQPSQASTSVSMRPTTPRREVKAIAKKLKTAKL